MTDDQLAQYLGIADQPGWRRAIDTIPASRRLVYERMATLETEIELWQKGLGPKPKGVLVDAARTPARAKGMLQRIVDRHRRDHRLPPTSK